MNEKQGAVRIALIALMVGLLNAVYTTIVMVNAGVHQDNLADRAQSESRSLTLAINKLADVLEEQNKNDRTPKGD
jgi:hypothetical protein